jgi:hypothetical protein
MSPYPLLSNQSSDVLLCLDPQKAAVFGPKIDHYVDLPITTEGDAGRLSFGQPFPSDVFV